MSRYMGDLSPQQEEALAQFREAVESIPNKPDDSDYCYVRWLKARKFDVSKAETMYRNHIEYRKKYGSDTILTDWTPPEVMTECFPGGFFGKDLDGHPVWYDNLGNIDIRGIHRSASLDDILKLKCMHSEKMDRICKEFTRKEGKHIDTVTVLIDFENISFQKHYYQPGIENLKKILAAEEANNPERVKTLILLKTPSFFPFCYNIVKHVLDERTKRKIVILGISSNWKEELQKYISCDELPAMYGGNRYEPDEECSDYINTGHDVPPKYYRTNQTETSKDEMSRVVVGRGSAHKEHYEVVDVGSMLQWEFFTTGYDISFGVSLKRNGVDGMEKDVICPVSRKESHLTPEIGRHSCLSPGTYVFKFDNSYSWTRSKEVFYSIKVLPPNVKPDPLALGYPTDNGHTHTGAHDGDTEELFFECNDDVQVASKLNS